MAAKVIKHFEFSFPLNDGKKPLGELIITGSCWNCEAGSPESYGFEPYGFEVSRVQFKAPYKLASDVTGLYQYLLACTKDGAENFGNATLQHVAYTLNQDAPYYAVSISRFSERLNKRA